MGLLQKLAPDEAARVLALAAASIKLRANAAPDARLWREAARPEQVPPEAGWRTFYLRGGRGGGKTWAGSHWLAERLQVVPGRYGVVAPTYADARDKCIEGDSGLLRALGTNRNEVDAGNSRLVEYWNRSLHDLRLRNGSSVIVDGADDGAPTIQGENLRGVWADEVGLWKRWQMAWEESIRYAVRIGDEENPAQIMVTGTPKRGHALVKLLLADEHVIKSVVKTMDNSANLDAGLLRELVAKYGGTALGRQELEGEPVDDVPGALWTRALIDRQRVTEVPELSSVVVAIDPAASTSEGAAETGIIAVGRTRAQGHGKYKTAPHDHIYILDDVSLSASPHGWASQAVALYNKLGASRIVAEKNQGGDMVEHTIRGVASSIPYTGVVASKGKVTRAEPVAALFEQGCAFIVGFLSDLEDQMCSFVAADKQPSPDRYDAMVWGVTSLSSQPDPGVLGYARRLLEQKEAERKAKETANGR